MHQRKLFMQLFAITSTFGPQRNMFLTKLETMNVLGGSNMTGGNKAERQPMDRSQARKYNAATIRRSGFSWSRGAVVGAAGADTVRCGAKLCYVLCGAADASCDVTGRWESQEHEAPPFIKTFPGFPAVSPYYTHSFQY